MRATFEVFSANFSSWHTLFEKAAALATELGPERLIGISHSADRTEGVVTVWYWEAES